MGRAAVIATPRRASALRSTERGSRDGAGRRAVSVAASEARLALAEVLIACDPGVECAERAVQWLVESGGARQALCLGLDTDQKRLVAMASHAVAAGSIHIDVDDRTHPVISVLYNRRPVVFDAKRDPGLLA